MILTGIRHALTIFVFAALPFLAFAETAVPAPTAEASAPKARPDIVGTVTDTDGQPVAGAIVFVDTAWPKVGRGVLCPSCYADCAKDATTDAQGRFRIADLDPTLGFNLLVASPRHMPTEHSVRNPGAAPQSIRLQPVKGGETADKRAVARVLDAAGRPVPGATLSIEAFVHDKTTRSVSGVVQPLAVTDATGRARIHATAPFDQLLVKVHARGCAPRPLRLDAGDAVQDIRLANGVTVSGKLLHNGRPVAGADLCIAPKDRSSENFVGKQQITTDRDGRFTFECVPAERAFQICATGETVRRLGTFAPREITTGANDSTLDLGDIALVPGHTVAGRVVLADGKPFPPHTRLMLSRQDAWGTDITELAPDGAFRFEHVAPGPVGLSLGLDDYRPTAGHSVNPIRCTHSIAGHLSGDKTDLVLRFEPGSHRQIEEVLATEPLTGAETTLPKPTAEPSAEAIQAAKAVREAKVRQLTEWGKKQRESAQKTRLTGRVIAKGNRPIAGATATVKGASQFREAECAYQPCPTNPLWDKSATCDADGYFDLGPNPEGVLILAEIHAPGFEPRQINLGLPKKQELPIVLEHGAQGEESLPIIITDESGKAIPDAVVRLQSHVEQGETHYPPRAVEGKTDDAGAARIPIGKGWDNITLRISAPGFAPRISERLHLAAQPHPLKLTRGATVAGRLLHGGKPLPGISVQAEEVNKDSSTLLGDLGQVTTDAEGRFRLDHLPTARPLAIYPTLKSLAAHGAISERTIDSLHEGQTLDLGDLQVLDGVKLAGRIRFKDGKSPDGVSISVKRGELLDSLEARCDETGRFRFDHVAKGTVRLDVVSADGYALTANNPCRAHTYGHSAVGQLAADKTDLLLELSPPDVSRQEAEFLPLHGVEKSPAAK